MKSALLLIDIQNDYFEGGKCQLYHSEEAAVHGREILEVFRREKLPVFHVQHISANKDATFFLPGTKGTEFYESVAPLVQEKVFIKHSPSAFLHTGLAEALLEQGIEHLVIAGMMSHMCVDTTVRAAQEYEFLVTLISDACTTKDLISMDGGVIPAQTVHDAFMAALNNTFAKVLDTKDFITQFESAELM
ncbi:cysteine hydrolase family protein [Anaerocolumna chitinilytica]|uniref:Isochorismatase n=1 Tax=Anaerocolumna chitinilytica TaxID=1727145 RepID=A0A7M3SB10_9FIRM|nr:cysteine hydrolase family protein [Anaerocolumna chitinilytica]BCK01778.1 isochorismatase [Anaerocolumna chitinilytica]